MKAAVLSNDMHDHGGGLAGAWAAFWAAAAAIGGAALGAAGLWLANRLMGKAAFQKAISEGFQALTHELQEERDNYRRMLDAERLAWQGERAQLRGDVINLTQAIESLKALLRRNGIEVPILPHIAEPGAVILEAAPPDEPKA